MVPAVALAAHAAQASLLSAQLSEGLVDVLNSAVGVKNQALVNA
jgi:hypothetical protein